MTMAVETQPTYLRSNFLSRQQREKEALEDIYRQMPVNVEVRFMRASRVADAIGVGAPFLDSALRVFEKCGILARRLEFGAKTDDGKTITGRSYHWTLLVSKNEAMDRLDKYHEKERDAINHPPSPRKDSLKSRILNALQEDTKFQSVSQLVKAIRRNGENLDHHNITHVLESLSKQGLVVFDRGHTKDRIPYNIRLAKNSARQIQIPTSVMSPASEIITDEEKVQPMDLDASTGFLDAHRAIVEEDQSTVEEDAIKYPTIMRLIRRREWLEQAAKLAESAEEEDMAIMLLDRANKPFSALELEVIKLYWDYLSCKESHKAQ